MITPINISQLNTSIFLPNPPIDVSETGKPLEELTDFFCTNEACEAAI